MDVEKLVPEAGNLAGFIEQFEVFARAPGGIKILRGLILDLAISGRLVSIKKSDTNAQQLLDEVINNRRKLEIDKKISKLKGITSTTQADFPFKIPKHWRSASFGGVADIIRGVTFPGSAKITHPMEGYVACLRTANVQQEVDWNDLIYIPKDRVKKASQWIKLGDCIISMANSYELVGKVSLVKAVPVASSFGGFIGVVRSLGINEQYLYLFLNSQYMQSAMRNTSSQTTNIANISLAGIHPIPFAFPGLEEQKRIVAKVDELMALCDKLEAQQQQQANNVLRANTAAINALLNSEPQQTEKNQKTSATVSVNEPKASFEQNWQRIAQHFNTLYGCTLPMPDGEGRKKKHLVGLENIRLFRHAVFELAITSKLHDGTSYAGKSKKYQEQTLKIKEEKIKKGIVKKSKKTSETVFLPEHGFVESWEYLPIGDMFDFIDYRGKTPKKSECGKRLISAKNIKNGYLSEDPVEYLSDTDYENWMTRGFPELGDIFLVTEGHTMGYMAINNRTDQFALAQRTITFQAYYEVSSRFYLYGMMSGFFQNQLINNSTGSAAKGVKAAKIKSLLMPVPCLEEQQCIVAKVDQLMTLCDQLEQQLTQSYNDAEKLMQATVKALVA